MLDGFACIKVKKDVCIKILYYNQLLFHTLVWIQWNRYRCRLALNRNSCVIRSRLLLFRSCALYCLSYEQLSSHLPLRYSHCCSFYFAAAMFPMCAYFWKSLSVSFESYDGEILTFFLLFSHQMKFLRTF